MRPARVVQSAIPLLWLQSATPALRFRFGTLCQWCIMFLPRIFYPFWAASQPKITNRSFWPSCDQMVLLICVRPKPGFGRFEVQPRVKFSKLGPRDTSDLYANGPESFPPGFFTPLWQATAGNYELVFLTGVRPIDVWSFWPLCNQERSQKSAINGGLKVPHNTSKCNWSFATLCGPINYIVPRV